MSQSSEQKQQEPIRRILVIGGNGVLGKSVVSKLTEFSTKFNKKLEIVIGGRTKDQVDVVVDISSSDSIKNMFTKNEKCKQINDVICCCGKGLFGALDDKKMDRNQMIEAFNSKVFGQMDLVMKCQDYLLKDGSITLTSGFTSLYSFPAAWGAAAQNSALEAFVKATPIEMKNNIRVNVVCPGLLNESAEHYASFFVGFASVDSSVVANAYIRSVFGGIRGKVLLVDNPDNNKELCRL
eukprot:658465_1